MNKRYKKTIWKSFIEGINTYELLKDGDRIAVLLTDDLNSLLAMLLLEELKQHGKIQFTPIYFSVIPVPNMHLLGLKTPVRSIKNNEEFLCRVKEEGCNKIVATTYFEEVAEVVLMQLLHEGCIKTVLPKERCSDGYEVIRPLYLVKEKHIREWEEGLLEEFTSLFKHKKEMSGFIKELLDQNPKVVKNIVKSMENVNLNTIISYHMDHDTVHFLDRYDLTDL